ncbi:MAG TPA: phage/plasmid primase, P4 family [Bacteroidales bacterium]|nr:phage/plasmid primase, P4 family [Bacteroidales bacterium]
MKDIQNIPFGFTEIRVTDIKNEVPNRALLAEPLPHKEILSALMNKINPVNFREMSGLEGDEKLKLSHFLIITVEEIMNLAWLNQWGICRNHDFIYLYNSAYWSLIDTDELKTFLGESSEKMGTQKYQARYYQFRDQLYKQFLALGTLPKAEHRNDIVLINLKNGTFEFSPTGTKLRQFEPKDFLTYQLPFEHDPTAKAPLFEKYLSRVLPDVESQNILSEYLGYVFIHPSILKLEKTLLLYGPGANGKSVFFDIVNAILGCENVSSYSLQSLTDTTGYFRAKLANKLVNYASEINGNLETSIFKQIVSGEPVEARLPYGEPFILSNYAKLIFNCNELPRDVEHTKAFFRRFLIIPFDVTIPDEEQDKGLSKKIIQSELPGVFNWILSGLNRLISQGNFSPCKAAELQLASYQRQSDSVQVFVEENEYQKHPSEYKLIKELYSEYRIFAIEDGFKPVSKVNFNKRLNHIGVIVEKKNIGNVAFLSKVATLYKDPF